MRLLVHMLADPQVNQVGVYSCEIVVEQLPKAGFRSNNNPSNND